MWRAMRMAGLTGGIQGMKGMLFGEPYAAGSWQDKLIEAFGGTHDVIGGQAVGLYEEHMKSIGSGRVSCMPLPLL